jgi:type II secretory pathway pseudopilin PulG
MRRDRKARTHSGFSLLEMMISLVILIGVTGVVMSGLLQATNTEGTVQNRTEMHASVRSATELMQQEIGQAGRIALPSPVTLTSAITPAGPATPSVSSTAGMFVGEYLVVDAGQGYPNGIGISPLPTVAFCNPSPCSNQETVQVTAVPSSTTFTAVFNLTHNSGAPVTVQGGLGTGVVPEKALPFNMQNGSDGFNLKLYGDINSDGNMIYVQYVCDTSGGNLYRSVSSISALTIAAKTVLLPNLQPNPPVNAPCFVYQEEPAGCNSTAANPCFVTDVAVTLTVQTQLPDPSTGIYQKETKALLNVSPRNVFDAYQLWAAPAYDRVQPMPSSVGPCASGCLTAQTP